MKILIIPFSEVSLFISIHLLNEMKFLLFSFGSADVWFPNLQWQDSKICHKIDPKNRCSIYVENTKNKNKIHL